MPFLVIRWTVVTGFVRNYSSDSHSLACWLQDSAYAVDSYCDRNDELILNNSSRCNRSVCDL
jgi:hypothetical protein